MWSPHQVTQPSSKSDGRGSSESTKTMKNSDKKKEVPWKCAKIRRTYPSADVEKTELRFVVYNKQGGEYDREGFLREAAVFLNQQAVHMEKTDDGVPNQPTFKSDSQPVAPSASQLPSNVWHRSEKGGVVQKSECEVVSPKSGVVLVRDLKKTGDCHHAADCKRAEALRISIPKVEEVIAHMEGVNSTRRRKELDAICIMAQMVLEDAKKALREGGHIGNTILERIQSVRAFACAVLHPDEESAVDMSTVDSSVKACSSLSRR